jgi:nucleoside-diphosphate-sugar epimerase
MKKNILIIGGDSFIATNFINYYKDVFSIKIISRKQTHFLNENVVKNIFNISDNFFKNIDVVINFCAIVHKKNVSKKTYKNINYELPVFLFNKSLSLGVKHFIQMSTISVYGRKSKIKFNSKLNPENSYGFYKLKADKYILKKKCNMRVTCIRPPMVYGLNAPGNMKSLIFISKLTIPLPFKNIENQLTFINIKNLIYFISIVINHNLVGVLIPNDKEITSTKDIIKTIRKILGKKDRLVSMPNFLKKIIRILFSKNYKKLFESLIVECNVDDGIYFPPHSISQGLEDCLKK